MPTISIWYPYAKPLGKNEAHKFSPGELGVVDGKLAMTKKSVVRKDKRTSADQAGITMALRGERNKPKGKINFRQAKVFVRIHVIRPKDPADGVRKDIDPINFQQYICDAVEKGIDVNDSWFESQVTWSVVSQDQEPMIFIEVIQEDWDNDEDLDTLGYVQCEICHSWCCAH
jgi:hypothetical protein